MRLKHVTASYALMTNVSKLMSRLQWKKLLGILNIATEVIPVGRLSHRRLVREVNVAITVHSRDYLRQVPRFLSDLFPWLDNHFLRHWVAWVPLSVFLRVVTDASDLGWGYQSSRRHQNHGGGEDGLREAHINVQKLLLALRFILVHKKLCDKTDAFEMDSVAAAYCLSRQGSLYQNSCYLSERISQEAQSQALHLPASIVQGADS